MGPFPKWALSLVGLISAFSAAQSIAPTNSTPFSYSGTPIEWAAQKAATPTAVQGVLLPLQDAAWQTLPDKGLKGVAIIPKTSNDSGLVLASNIVFVQCDPTLPQAPIVLQTAVTHNPVAVILFSNTSNYCSFTPGSFISSGFNSIYTITSAADAGKLTPLLNSGGDTPMNALIARQSAFGNMSSNSTGPPSQPGGPSPSTAVAMIILYSITGVITALFLLIIVTGAVRAHRHPERYGPRNVVGRPRQSRAKGLGRAILDTIPIVKFGEKEPKPNDVEMSSAAGAADTTARSETEAGTQDTTVTRANCENEGVAADDPPAITEAATPAAEPTKKEETQGCSICTEDFEKGQDVRVLPCHHSFHPACIDPWLLNVSGTCPLCRVDLRPASPRHSEALEHSEAGSSFRRPSFAPPLDAELDDHPAAAATAAGPSHRASRRISAFFDVLNPHRMENASAQERLAALRRLREERRRAAMDDDIETRRIRRLTARLHDSFHIRTRARGSESPRATTGDSAQAMPGAEGGSITQARGASPARISPRGAGSRDGG